MIDIYSKGEYPANELSNFAQHKFTFDGIECNSLEGFLQSLKYKDPQKQKYVCSLHGENAKNAGKKKRLWKITKNVWWNGVRYKLYSDDLQILIDKAFYSCFINCLEFREALRSTGDEELTHSIGKTDSSKTILSTYSFIRRLYWLRTIIDSVP